MDLYNTLSDKNIIKNLNNANSQLLSSEIRKFLVDKVMSTGGHLASNLGVVELTLALHKVFDFPNDKIVFDVGHQSYVHKMLSGRCEMFDYLRKLDGLSGFPKREESVFDSFNTGHSSTSISAALGIAKARDLNKDNYKVIAFIGDGAMGGGMAFEALNDSGASETDLIIVLNDNEMSINKNVGGLSAHLSMLRLNESYRNAKNKTRNILKKTGIIGKGIIKAIKFTKRAIKFATIAIPMFEYLGVKYIGIIDGHDIDDLSIALNKAKNMKGPVIVHVLTRKGKGYIPAEENPDIYHGVSGNKSNTSSGQSYTSAFGEYMVQKAGTKNNMVAITAAMCSGCGLTDFAIQYPDRFYDVGIAEQHAVTLAAGLATENIVPVFSVYSTFLQRAYDQILHDVCLQNLHVVFAIDRAGVVGEDGETHQGVFDFSYLSHMPGMTVLAPSCQKELIQMLDYAIDECTGPVAVRYPKTHMSVRECEDFVPKKAEIVADCGDDIVLFSVGRMFDTCKVVFDKLKSDGYGVKFINVRTIKPIDKEFVDNMIDKCILAITVEDNEINGGAGQCIASCANRKLRNKIINLGFNDCIVRQGTQNQLFEIYGLSAEKIINTITKELNYNEQQN